jgi:beta-galactosidase
MEIGPTPPGESQVEGMNRIRSIVLGLTILTVGVLPASAQRQRLSMDPGWRFVLGDPAGAERPNFDDRRWRRLDLPHDWSIEEAPRQDAPGGGRVGFFPSGIGWYRKAFRLPEGKVAGLRGSSSMAST